MAHDNADPMQLASHSDHPQPTQVQPTIAPQGCIALPAETIYHILRSLDPQDLIRLQAVSKLFHAIIHDPAIWRANYSTVRLPLPPGPFPWQSIHFLQRTLVQSARLARAWTSNPLTIIPRETLKGPRSIRDDRFRWVRGRWLIVSKDMKQLLSRDVETGSEQVLWDHGSFAYWAATSVMNPLAHFLYIAVHLVWGRPSDPVKLLEFVVNDDTGHLSGPEILDVPTWSLPQKEFVPRIRLDSSLAPYAYISLDPTEPRQSLIFDPRHRCFFKFPRFRTQLDLLLNYRGAWQPNLVEVYFTQTHLFVRTQSYLVQGNIDNVEIIQTFAFPDIDSHPDPNLRSNGASTSDRVTDPIVWVLRLTHEILSRDMKSLWLSPVCKAVVDPIAQTTTFRFMHTYAPFPHDARSHVRFLSTDYILPAPQSGSTRTFAADEGRRGNSNDNDDDDDPIDRSLNNIVRNTDPVLPIIVASHDLFSIQGKWDGNLVDVSDEGFVRGLCLISRYSAGSFMPDLKMVFKFTVDATGEQCIAVVGDQSPLCGLATNRFYEWYSFDGMRGKLWRITGDVVQLDSAGRSVDGDVLAHVADIE